MKRLPPTPTVGVAPDRFTGHAWVDNLATGEPPSRLRLAMVRFEPGARTAWHRHALGQTLHVTDGLGIVQNRDGLAILLRPGETIHTPPGEWHWHGALPDRFMSHLAVSETSAGPDTTDVVWADLITDDEYQAAIDQVGQANEASDVQAGTTRTGRHR